MIGYETSGSISVEALSNAVEAFREEPAQLGTGLQLIFTDGESSSIHLTWGEMPTREQFDEAWNRTAERECRNGDSGGVQTGEFGFERDPRVGDCRLSQDELWNELQKAAREYEARLDDVNLIIVDEVLESDPEQVSGWISQVLTCLGIEWV